MLFAPPTYASHKTLAGAGLLTLFAGMAQASPALSASGYAYVGGSISSSYSSPLVGNVSFTINGTTDYSSTNGTPAQASYNIAAGHFSSGDPVYDIVTSYGQYGYSYSSEAEVKVGKLKTQIVSAAVDSTGAAVNYAGNSSVSVYADATWNTQFYVKADAHHAAGSYGAILVGITLDGTAPQFADPNISNNAGATLQASSNFSDTAGVSYSSSFSVNSYANSSAPSQTTYQKLLFQYGTPYTVTLYQWLSGWNNSSADFFNTGKISSIELPYGANLQTGLDDLGSLSDLFGNVTHSLTLDAQNTTWDFGNNGGGFTPPSSVPVPAAVWLFGSGFIGMLGLSARKRNAA